MTNQNRFTAQTRRAATALTLFTLLLVGCINFGQPRDLLVLYLWRDDAGIQQLYITTTDGTAEQLTESPYDIREFSPSPDGEKVAYVVALPSGEHQLWLLQTPRSAQRSAEPLLDCTNMQCRGATWANDSRRIIYEQRDIGGSIPRLWWLDTETGDTLPVFSDESIIGYGARFSANNDQLSYVNVLPPEDWGAILPPGHSINDGHNHSFGLTGPQQIIKVFNFTTGQEQSIPNLQNAFGVWHPTEPELLLTDMQVYGERFGVHIMHVDSAESDVTDLAENTLVEDSSPAWSPGGDTIAFGRKQAQAPMGAQLWLMDADGSNPRAQTEDTNIHHGLLAWHPTDNTILYQRFDISQPQSDPQVWLYDVSADTHRVIVSQGFQPAWLR